MITHISWGRIEVSVAGQTLTFKDCKIWPGGAIEWDWTLTGTHHRPGIQVADLGDVLAHNPDVIILSRGMQRRLQTTPQVEEHLSQRNIPYHIDRPSNCSTRWRRRVSVPAGCSTRPASIVYARHPIS